MKIEEEIKLNSIMIDKNSKDIEMIRQRTHEIKQKVAVHDYSIAENIKTVMESLKMIKENKEMLNTLCVDVYAKRNALDVIADRFTNTKTLVILIIAFVVFEACSVTPIVFKHILGW